MEADALHISITADVGNAGQEISKVTEDLTALDDQAKKTDSGLSQLVTAVSSIAGSLTGIGADVSKLAAGIGSAEPAAASAAASISALSASSESSSSALSGLSASAGAFAAGMSEMRGAAGGAADDVAALGSSVSAVPAALSGAGDSAQTAAKKISGLSAEVQGLPTHPPLELAAAFGKLKGAVAALGIGKFIKDSDDAYNVQMQNELKLTAHMKHRLNATDEEIQSIKDLASEQQKLGVIGDEVQLAGAQQLTTYARQSSTLKTLIPAMNNLIAQNAGYDASAGDATSAADMLGRALNGQYTSLKHMGITFTEAQQNVLKYGTESQKAAVLAQTINDKVGNMNELLAQTPTGEMKQFSNDLGDVQEEIGAIFQELKSSAVPLLYGFMSMLKEPVMNVARGISVIGQALISLDSPATRTIALTVGAIVLLSKLKTALGGPVALLITLGTILAGIAGAASEQQESIGDIVNDAYSRTADSIGNATDEMSGFREETENTQKAVSKLAGFDTITKLSGSSSGSLAAGLFGDIDGYKDDLADVKKAAEDIDLHAGLALDTDLDTLIDKIKTWVGEQDWQLLFLQAGNGLEDAFSDGLGILDKIFGTDLQTTFDETRDHFFEVGKEIEGAMQELGSGDGYKALKGVNTLLVSISDILTGGLVTEQVNGWNEGWRTVGSGLYDLLHPSEQSDKSHGIYTPENTEGIINEFSPIEGAPMAAYYRWGSSGMPTAVPKQQIKVKDFQYDKNFRIYEEDSPIYHYSNNAPASYLDVPLKRNSQQSAGGVNVDVTVNVDGEQVQADSVTKYNGQ